MVDNTVVISETGHCNDGVITQQHVTIQEVKGNLLDPNVATGTDAKGDTSGFYNDNVSQGHSIISTIEEAYSGNRSIKYISKGYGGARTVIYLKPHMIYTSQIMVKSISGTPLRTWFCANHYHGDNPTGETHKDATATGDWQKITNTITTINGGFYMFTFGIDLSTGGTVYGDSLQVEEGSTATDWKYPSIGPESESLVVKPKVILGEHTGNYYPENIRTTEYPQSIVTNPSIGTPPTITQTDEVVYPGFKHSMKVQWNHIDGDYWKGECHAQGVTIPKGSKVKFKIKTYAPIPFSVHIYSSGSCAGSNVQHITVGPQWDTWILEYTNNCPYGNGFNLYFYGPSAQNVMYVTGIECYDYEGSGVQDSVSVLAKIPIPEHGSVNEQLVVKVNDFVSDVMHSNDTVAIKTLTELIDNCAGYEDLALKIAMILADSGKGTDAVWRVCEFMKCLLKMKYPKAILKMKYPKAILKMKYPR